MIGTIFVILGVALLPLRPSSLDMLGFSVNSGYADIQLFEMNPGPFVMFEFRQYFGTILFSLQSPDGSFLVHGANVSSFSYSFPVTQRGYYVLNLSAPLPSYGVHARLNITFYEPLIGQYLIGASNCKLRLPSSPANLPSKMGCVGPTGGSLPACGTCS